MSGEITLRHAIVADRQAIGRLWSEMMEFHREYDPAFFRMKPDALDVWLQYLDECMENEEHIILVAEAGEGLIGLAMGRPGEDPPPFDAPRHGFITNFVIAEQWRGRGLGQQLYQAIAAEFEKAGLTEVRLSVSVKNPASNAFWQQMGFEPFVVQMRRAVSG